MHHVKAINGTLDGNLASHHKHAFACNVSNDVLPLAFCQRKIVCRLYAGSIVYRIGPGVQNNVFICKLRYKIARKASRRCSAGFRLDFFRHGVHPISRIGFLCTHRAVYGIV